VSWKSTKQKRVSLSTTEAEWYVTSEAGKEIVYLRSFLNDFGFERVSPTLFYEDSRAVIDMVENRAMRDGKYGGRCIDKGSTCSSI
jgi:hypothetical protein